MLEGRKSVYFLAVFVEDLLRKPRHELRLVAGSQSAAREAGPSHKRCSVTQAVQFDHVASARLTWDVIS